MTQRRSRPFGFTALLVVMVVSGALSAGARASHYRLPVEGFISPEETALLSKAGVRTTLALLQQVGTAAQRKRLVELTGLAAERVEALAGEVDLLRIDGLGPSMARLLVAAGVPHTRSLGAEAPASLLARMKAANEASRIANVLPREALLAAWIGAAQRLPAVLSGLP